MARMLGNNEAAFEAASSQFWVVDANVSSFTYNLKSKKISSNTSCLISLLNEELQVSFLIYIMIKRI